MIEARIAASLLSTLASGGTVERVLAELPMFRSQIELGMGWLKAKAQCTDAEIEDRVVQLREIVLKKDKAIKNQDWHVAADLRENECIIFDSFGLNIRRSVNPSASFFSKGVPVENHIRDMAKLLNENHELNP